MYDDARDWRLVLPGNTPPLGDVFRWTTRDEGLMRRGGYEFDGLIEPEPGESPEQALQRYVAERN